MSESTKPAAGGSYMSLRSAIFLGVSAMVGAGIFALMGEAGSMAGNATWVSFLIAGAIALLSGYSFAMLGARYPSNGGQIEFLMQEYGIGVFSGGLSIMFMAGGIVTTAMAAQTFGSYASYMFFGDGAAAVWTSIFAALLILFWTVLNFVGGKSGNKIQAIAVVIAVGVLIIFIIAALGQLQPDLLSPSDWPSGADILASVAVTFFAFTGFGVLTNAAGQMENPKKELKQAIFGSVGITIVLYTMVAVGVFGVLAVDKIIDYQNTAVAAAMVQVMGSVGAILIGIAALFATATSVYASLFGALGVTWDLAEKGVLPSRWGERMWKSGTYGLAIVALLATLMAIFLDLTFIASLGSILVLLVWVVTNLGHYRLQSETKVNPILLGLATIASFGALAIFLVYTWGQTPSIVIVFVGVTAATFVLEWVLRASGHKKGMQAEHPTHQPQEGDAG